MCCCRSIRVFIVCVKKLVFLNFLLLFAFYRISQTKKIVIYYCPLSSLINCNGHKRIPSLITVKVHEKEILSIHNRKQLLNFSTLDKIVRN